MTSGWQPTPPPPGTQVGQPFTQHGQPSRLSGTGLPPSLLTRPRSTITVPAGGRSNGTIMVVDPRVITMAWWPSTTWTKPVGPVGRDDDEHAATASASEMAREQRAACMEPGAFREIVIQG